MNDKDRRIEESRVETIHPTPHSGKAGHERPVNEFDKTPLSSVEEGVLTAPYDISTLPENMPSLDANTVVGAEPSPYDDDTKKPRKSHNKLFVALGTATALAIGVVGTLVVTKDSGESKVSAGTPAASAGPAADSGSETSSAPTTQTPETPTTLSDLDVARMNKVWVTHPTPEFAEADKLTQDNIQPVLQTIFNDVTGFVQTDNMDFMNLALADTTNPSSQTFINQYGENGQSNVTYGYNSAYYQDNPLNPPFGIEVVSILQFDPSANTVVAQVKTQFVSETLTSTKTIQLKQKHVVMQDKATGQFVPHDVWSIDAIHTSNQTSSSG